MSAETGEVVAMYGGEDYLRLFDPLHTEDDGDHESDDD